MCDSDKYTETYHTTTSITISNVSIFQGFKGWIKDKFTIH